MFSPSPSGCLRATSEFLFLGTRGAATDESGGGSAVRCNPMTTIEQAVCTGVRKLRACTQGFPTNSTPYPTMGDTGGLHTGRSWRRKTGKQAVCAHLWRADACAQGVPVADRILILKLKQPPSQPRKTMTAVSASAVRQKQQPSASATRPARSHRQVLRPMQHHG